MKHAQQRILDQKAQNDHQHTEKAIESQTGKDHLVDPVVILMRVVLRDVLNKGITQSEVQQIEGISKDRKENPHSEIADAEVGQDIGREEKIDQKAPRASEHIEKCVRGKLLREIPQECDLQGLGCQTFHCILIETSGIRCRPI